MAKDPAVLFYTSDFLTGTALMNMEQRGMYMTLLCLQHQQGHLSEEDMLDVCGKKDRKVFSKFKLDDDGLYYNERMDIELKKRKEYSQSRSENGKKGGRPKKQNESKTEANENHMESICLPYEKHSENENINDNTNIDDSKYTIDNQSNQSNSFQFHFLKNNSAKKEFSTAESGSFPQPPSLTEIISEVTARRRNDTKYYMVDPYRFHSHYKDRDWRFDDGSPVDWKKALEYWVKTEEVR
jgi:uncharacterized protein YdaU (DUF1376 family)